MRRKHKQGMWRGARTWVLDRRGKEELRMRRRTSEAFLILSRDKVDRDDHTASSLCHLHRRTSHCERKWLNSDQDREREREEEERKKFCWKERKSLRTEHQRHDWVIRFKEMQRWTFFMQLWFSWIEWKRMTEWIGKSERKETGNREKRRKLKGESEKAEIERIGCNSWPFNRNCFHDKIFIIALLNCIKIYCQ